jgi:peptidyl-prolyl cis-trans isomerase SurA
MPIRFLTILALLALAGPLAAQPYQIGNASPQVVDKIIGRVDNYIILQSELEVGYLQAMQQTEHPRGNMRCKVLESLIINKMMLAKAEIDSVTVESRAVDDQLERRMQYMVASLGGREKLETYYKKSVDQLKSELRKDVRNQMIVQKMQENITKDLKVTPNEVRKFFGRIPSDSLPYFSKEVEVGQIVRLPKVSRAKKTEAREKLLGLRERVLKGEDFGFLAQIYSDDKGSAADSGRIGLMGRGDLVPEYEAASNLLKPGEMSQPVETQFGYHLIQLIGRQGAKYNTRHILIKPTTGYADLAEAELFLDSLRGAIATDSITFEKAAKLYSEDEPTKGSGGLFTDQNTNSSRVATENLDPVIYFAIDTLPLGGITRPLPFRTEDGKEAMRIIYYKSKTPPHEANLKDDYQKINHATLQEKKATTMNTWFERTRQEIFVSIDPQYDECDVIKGKDMP